MSIDPLKGRYGNRGAVGALRFNVTPQRAQLSPNLALRPAPHLPPAPAAPPHLPSAPDVAVNYNLLARAYPWTYTHNDKAQHEMETATVGNDPGLWMWTLIGGEPAPGTVSYRKVGYRSKVQEAADLLGFPLRMDIENANPHTVGTSVVLAPSTAHAYIVGSPAYVIMARAFPWTYADLPGFLGSTGQHSIGNLNEWNWTEIGYPDQVLHGSLVAVRSRVKQAAALLGSALRIRGLWNTPPDRTDEIWEANGTGRYV